MNVTVLEECGYQHALLGLSLSFDRDPSGHVAEKLAHRQGGHNKFLESMIVYLDITAPRYWWQQFDTYRVGTTKQSGSTMHTILSRQLTQDDFEGGCDTVILNALNVCIYEKDFEWVKRHLPESFLQRRIVCTNYKVLQSMMYQRKSHRLSEWQFFLSSILAHVKYPHFIRKPE